MKFELSKEQVELYEEWCKTKSEVYVGMACGAFTFEFTPTGLGTIVVVKCADGTELDLTEWKYF